MTLETITSLPLFELNVSHDMVDVSRGGD